MRSLISWQTLSVRRDAPLLLKAERKTVEINKQQVTFLVVARLERLAEKIRAFLGRGLDRDAFDLYYFSTNGFPASTVGLAGLVKQKIREDVELPADRDLLELFDEQLRKQAGTYGKQGGLVFMTDAPAWTIVEPHVRSYRRHIPRTKPR